MSYSSSLPDMEAIIIYREPIVRTSKIGESWKLVYEWTSSKLGEAGSRRCSRRSAVVTATYCLTVEFDGSSKSKAATLKIFERLGMDDKTVGCDGAGTAHLRFPSSTPSFSKLRLRSNVFFSWSIDSIVTELLDPAPVSGGKSASLTKLFKVYRA